MPASNPLAYLFGGGTTGDPGPPPERNRFPSGEVLPGSTYTPSGYLPPVPAPKEEFPPEETSIEAMPFQQQGEDKYAYMGRLQGWLSKAQLIDVENPQYLAVQGQIKQAIDILGKLSSTFEKEPLPTAPRAPSDTPEARMARQQQQQQFDWLKLQTEETGRAARAETQQAFTMEQNQLNREIARMQAEIARGNLELNAALGQLDKILAAQPLTLPQGAEYIPGFEPGGSVAEMHRLGGISYNPELARAAPQNLDIGGVVREALGRR